MPAAVNVFEQIMASVEMPATEKFTSPAAGVPVTGIRIVPAPAVTLATL